jgi:hypothetical protein
MGQFHSPAPGSVLWANDFFTTEIWTRWGPTTHYVLFFTGLHAQTTSLATLQGLFVKRMSDGSD